MFDFICIAREPMTYVSHVKSKTSLPGNSLFLHREHQDLAHLSCVTRKNLAIFQVLTAVQFRIQVLAVGDEVTTCLRNVRNRSPTAQCHMPEDLKPNIKFFNAFVTIGRLQSSFITPPPKKAHQSSLELLNRCVSNSGCPMTSAI